MPPLISASGQAAALVAALACCQVCTAQQLLSPPERIEYRAEEHFQPSYRLALQQLGQALTYFDDPLLDSLYSTFFQTLDQLQIRQAIQQIRKRADSAAVRSQSRGQEGQLRTELRQAALAVQRDIDESRYIDGAPIDFILDPDKGHYLLKWRDWTGEDWSGDLQVRTIPMVPEMHLMVSASYDPRREGGSYGYSIQSGNQSQGLAGALWIECLELDQPRLRQLEKRGPFSAWVRAGGRELKADIGIPFEGYLQDFRLSLYDRQEMKVFAGPGENMAFPPLLSVPWPQTPGVVRCWLEVGARAAEVGNQPQGLSGESDPENALEAFSTYRIVPTPQTGPKKIPRWMYQGHTLGPVPAPPSEAGIEKLLKRLAGHYSQARQLGWCPDEDLANRIERQVLQAGRSVRPASVLSLIDSVDQAYSERLILQECHSLLKFNLLHLKQQLAP